MKLFQIIVVAGSLLHPFVASADTTVTLRGAVQAASDEAAAIDADLGNHQRGSRDFCNNVCWSDDDDGYDECFDDCRDNLKDFCDVSELGVGHFRHITALANVRVRLLFATVRTHATSEAETAGQTATAKTTATTRSAASPEIGAAGAGRRAAAAPSDAATVAALIAPRPTASTSSGASSFRSHPLSACRR